MSNFYLISMLLFVFFMVCIGQILKLNKEVRKLNNIVKHLLEKNK